MYTRRFTKPLQQPSLVSQFPIVFSQSTQTQVTCPAATNMSFQISHPLSSASSKTQESLSKKSGTFKPNSTQTDICLDPSNTDLELKVLNNIKQKVIESRTTEDKAIQTSTSVDESSNKAPLDTSNQAKGLSAEIPSTTTSGSKVLGSLPVHTTPAKKPILSPRDTGLKLVSLEEEERRKKEELLAKLRAMDGAKNPPQSQPIESTAVRRGSIQTTSSQDTPGNQPFLPGVGKGSEQSTGSQDNIRKSHDNQPFRPPVGMGSTQDQITGTQAIHHSPPINRQSSQSVTTTVQATGSQAVGSNQPISLLGHGNFSGTQQSKRSSLMNFSRSQLTSGATDLSALRQRRVTSPMANTTLDQVAQQNKEKLMAKLMAADKEATGRAEQSTSTLSKASSRASLQSWPDTIQNMHTGKPAYATETDPFGSKHVAAQATRNSSEVKTGSQSDPKEYKPMHGRRAANTDKPRLLTGDLKTISENHPGSNPLSGLNIKPNSDDEAYPWEVPINVQTKELEIVGKGRETRKATNQVNATTASMRTVGAGAGLLPLRPKQTGTSTTSYGMMQPGSLAGPVTEPDDLEEVVL